MKRRDLLRHLQVHGCALKREGGNHSLWHHLHTGQSRGAAHAEIGAALSRKICRALSVPMP